MRIAQTADGRYVKVISPQMQGLINRLYQEITERKESDDMFKDILNQHQNQLAMLSSQIETTLIRYAEVTDLLRQLLPEDESYALIDRALEVNGTIRAHAFISTSLSEAPLQVSNSIMVQKLNVEMLNGYRLEDIQADTDKRIADYNLNIDQQFEEERSYNKLNYAPIEHVNAGGVGAHPYTTYTDAGFMSPLDKKHHDEMKTKLDTLQLPGGIVIGNTAPSSPKLMQVWIDMN